MKLFYYLFLGLLFPAIGFAQTPLYNFDFDGGFQEWETKSVECDGQASEEAVWIWEGTGKIDQGAYSKFGLMDSRTPENGIVMLNSDYLDGDGKEENLGNGPCPSPQISELISPALDFSDNDSVLISFNQLYSRFGGYYNDAKGIDDFDSTATFLGISIDGQQTWKDLSLNDDLRMYRNATNYAGELTLDISEYAAGHPEVHVRFMWKGDYYVWAIDDVRFYSARHYDLDVPLFKFPVSNFETPLAQFVNDTIRFEANVVNNGTKTVDSAYLHVLLRSQEGEDRTVHYRDSLLLENLAPNDTVEAVLPGSFLPEKLGPGTYAFFYQFINTDQGDEINLANNTQADVFRVTENRFSKTDRGDLFGYIFNDDYIIGNYYEINENVSERMLLDKINFSAFGAGDTKLQGKTVSAYLLKIDDDVEKDLSNWNFTEPTTNKKELVAFGTYAFSAADDGDNSGLNDRFEVSEFINLEEGADPESPVELKPGSRYIAAIEYEGNAAKDIIHQIGERITYYPETGQYSTMIFDHADSRWYPGGFGTGKVAVIGMEVNLEVTPTEEELTVKEVKVFPNPTSDYIQVRMELDQVQKVDLHLTDVSGKSIKNIHHSKVASDLIRIDVTDIPAGTYFLSIYTAQGKKVQKISVMH